MTIATDTATALASAAPSVDVAVGKPWMTHAEMAALGMPGAAASAPCTGTVRFTDLRKPIKEASCDADDCAFTITARLDDIARSLQTREEPWYQR